MGTRLSTCKGQHHGVMTFAPSNQLPSGAERYLESATRRYPLDGYSLDVTRFGYTLMTEQSGSRELVRYAVEAERRGFDLEASRLYSP